jgi:uncharacterized protein (TIGR03492 family)
LFVSNGHGEDAIGGYLAQTFLELDPTLEIEAMPVIGRGAPYERAGVRVLGPRADLPSGGFTFTSINLLLGDWRAGLRQMCHDQFWAIRGSQPDAVIVVGDIYALWATLRFTRKDGRKPSVFQYQPLVSVRYSMGMTAKDRLDRLNRVTVDAFIAPERWLMKSAERVYTRDEPSAAHLRNMGVPHARFVGNLMMDLLTPELDLEPILDGRPVLALLPGSRDDHLFSFPLMLQALEHAPEVQALGAFHVNLERIPLPTGWSWATPTDLERAVTAERAALHVSGARVPILQDAFAAVLHAAQAVIGTTGTANEQAVGLGKPVIGFPTHGPQYLEPFAKAQQRLLGPGLILTNADAPEIAAAVRQTLTDTALLETALCVGPERMGVPGGALQLAKEVLERIGSQKTPSWTQI